MRGSALTSMKGPMGASLALHLSLLAVALVGFRPGKIEPLPPIYRVNIVAAPPGPRAIGQVNPPRVAESPPVEPPTVTAPPAPTRPVREPAVPTSRTRPIHRPAPSDAPAAASPNTPAPRAGGGPIGGRGTDVATVQTEGIDFPFPGYLNNIVRQIALRFSPSDTGAGLRAEMRFVIRRDGSVIGVGFVTRSGNYGFDLEAQGAVEAASRHFGPLPEGFRDDALPVVFSFDPRVIR